MLRRERVRQNKVIEQNIVKCKVKDGRGRMGGDGDKGRRADGKERKGKERGEGEGRKQKKNREEGSGKKRRKKKVGKRRGKEKRAEEVRSRGRILFSGGNVLMNYIV